MAKKIYCQPTNDQFAEELVKEPNWYDLGVFLKVPTFNLDTIALNYSSHGTMMCLIEMYKCINSSDRLLCWGEIANALERMRNVKLAVEIRHKFIDPGKCEAPQEAENKNSVIFVPMEVSSKFSEIVHSFASLILSVKRTLKQAVERDVLQLEELQCVIQELYDLPPLFSEENNLEKTFSRLRQYYCFLNYEILVCIVKTFSFDDLLVKINDYTKTLNTFKETAKVQDLMHHIHETRNVVDEYSSVELKLRDYWCEVTVQKFDRFISQLFMDLYSAMSHIRVEAGCISINWVIPFSLRATKLLPLDLHYFKVIGVLSLKIDNQVLYEGPKFGCETVESSLLQAIELKNTRGIELLLAIAYNSCEISLLANIIGITDKLGFNALYYACFLGHTDVVKLLLEAGASPDIAGSYYSVTPLIVACEQNQTDTIKELIAKGASPCPRTYTPLMVACWEGHNEIVKFMFTETIFKSTVNYKSEDGIGCTALQYACSRGHSSVVSTLLDAGADPNEADSEGMTPLMEASVAGHSKVVDVLLFKSGTINCNTQTADGRTALYFAAMGGYANIVHKLVLQGADRHPSNNFSPLTIANQKGYSDIIKLLTGV